MSLSNYLTKMDYEMKKLFKFSGYSDTKYVYGQSYLYKEIEFQTNSSIEFGCLFYAVKVYKTTVILQDNNTIKAYFSDGALKSILSKLKKNNPEFYNYLKVSLGKVANKEFVSDIQFLLDEESYTINGIPFENKYNNVLCDNPADIEMTGNDLIGLLNLIFEKERADRNKTKVIDTYKKYFSID